MFSPFAFIGMPGPLEMFVIAFIILLLFGNRLPSVMRSMGRGIVEFKKMCSMGKGITEFNNGIKGIEDEVEEVTKVEDDSDKIGGKVEKEAFKK